MTMTSEQLWVSYIRPMGAGAVAAAGLITLLKTLPTIIESFRAGWRDLAARRQAAQATQLSAGRQWKKHKHCKG